MNIPCPTSVERDHHRQNRIITAMVTVSCLDTPMMPARTFQPAHQTHSAHHKPKFVKIGSPF
jgi:hypothetical protein